MRRYGQAAEVALPTLSAMAKSAPSQGARLSAAVAMEAMGPAGVAALIYLLAPGESPNRWSVVLGLGRMGMAPAPPNWFKS